MSSFRRRRDFNIGTEHIIVNAAFSLSIAVTEILKLRADIEKVKMENEKYMDVLAAAGTGPLSLNRS